MNPATWHKNFLQTRGFNLPPGFPLYSYKITAREYLTLMDVLRVNIPSSSGWDCCFVMYATEWWRKEYEGGPWSWEQILKSINKSWMGVPQRNQLVADGFKKWKRIVNEDLRGNDFIGTVVLESGLSLGVLGDGHYLTSIITELYREIGAISKIETEHLSIVKEITERRRLPQSLQKQPFFHLLLQFVTTLVKFNEKFGFSGIEKPVEALDRLSPGWREQFPLRVENHIGKNFIDQLLTGVTKVHEINPSMISINYELRFLTNVWFVNSNVSIKGGQYSAEALGIDASEFKQLSHKLEIYITRKQGDQKIGVAFKDHEKQCFHIDNLKKYNLDLELDFAIGFYLLDARNCRIYTLNVSSGYILQTADPLIFASENDDQENNWRLIAVGSSKLQEGTYRVITSRSAVLKNGEWKLVADISWANKEKRIYEIRVPCSIEESDNQFQIDFEEGVGNFTYELIPVTKGFDFYSRENKNVFVGWPKIYKIRRDGVVIGQVRSALQYLQANGRWASLSENVFGRLRIRLQEDDRTLFCRTVVVVPEDFAVEFDTSGKKVTLLNSDSFTVSVDQAIKCQVVESAAGHIINFDTAQGLIEPDFFIIKLTSKHSIGKAIYLKLPYPRNETYFYSPTHERLPSRATIYLNNIYGHRLYLSNLTSLAKTYQFRLSLTDIQVAQEISVFRSVKVPSYGNLEIALITLKEQILSLFSISTNIDAGILITCERATAEIRLFQGNIQATERGIVHTNTSVSDHESPEIKAFRLDIPFLQDEQIRLSLTDKNYWGLPPTDGVWFIYPSSDTKQQFRPICHRLGDDPKSNRNLYTELHQVAVFPKEERLEHLSKVLAFMSTDFGHPDWSRLSYLFDETRQLPLSTQNVFSVLSNQVGALMASVLMLHESVIERLSEEFAIIWFHYPVSDWNQTFGKYHHYLENKLPSFAQQILKGRIDWLSNHFGLSSLKWIIEKEIFNQSAGQDSAAMTVEILRFLIQEKLHGADQKAGLRGRHHLDRWPHQLNDMIIQLVEQLPREVADIVPVSMARYQKGVVYLPFVLAAASALPQSLSLPMLKPLMKFRIQEIIAFDEEWFLDIYNFVQAYLWNQKSTN